MLRKCLKLPYTWRKKQDENNWKAKTVEQNKAWALKWKLTEPHQTLWASCRLMSLSQPTWGCTYSLIVMDQHGGCLAPAHDEGLFRVQAPMLFSSYDLSTVSSTHNFPFSFYIISECLCPQDAIRNPVEFQKGNFEVYTEAIWGQVLLWFMDPI